MPKRNDLEQKALHSVINTGYEGVLQSELWRELGASSREGSRVALKLEEKGLIRREKELQERAIELLNFMGIEGLRNELAKNLPFGYHRLLSIVVALATDPEVLLLDEPLSGMNAEEVDKTLNQIDKIVEGGTTVVLVEHNMRAVMRICKNIYVLNFGKKIAEGSPEEIVQNSDVIKAYLGEEQLAT